MLGKIDAEAPSVLGLSPGLCHSVDLQEEQDIDPWNKVYVFFSRNPLPFHNKTLKTPPRMQWQSKERGVYVVLCCTVGEGWVHQLYHQWLPLT